MTNPTSLCVATRAFKARATVAFERIVATSPKAAPRRPAFVTPADEIELDDDAALTVEWTEELGGSAIIWACEGTDPTVV